jgi:transcriptional regulator with XRE-family HTH domain
MRTKLDGDAVRRLREEQGLSTLQLAHAVGKNRTYIWRLEEGKRLYGSAKTRLDIARALGVGLAEITLTEPDGQPNPAAVAA